MANKNTDKFDNKQHTDLNLQLNSKLGINDFDKMMDDTFEETTDDVDRNDEEDVDQKQAATIPDAAETSELSPTNLEIPEIISKNELIENATRAKIRTIISKQEQVLEIKEENLNKLMADFDLHTRKRKLTKKALKKAKELKLGTDKMDLIKMDLKQTKEMLKSCKARVEQEESDIKNQRRLIGLLETIL